TLFPESDCRNRWTFQSSRSAGTSFRTCQRRPAALGVRTRNGNLSTVRSSLLVDWSANALSRNAQCRFQLSRRLSHLRVRFFQLDRRLGRLFSAKSVLTQLWCTCGTCGTFAIEPYPALASSARPSRPKHYDDPHAAPRSLVLG